MESMGFVDVRAVCDFLTSWLQMSSDEKDAFVKDHLCPEFPVVDGRQFVPTAELRIRGLLDLLATQPGVLADKVLGGSK